MASIAAGSTQAAKLEVLERVGSFAALRGAQRALEPSSFAPGALPEAERWRAILERLSALSKSLTRGADDAAAGELELRPELAEIDDQLAELKNELLAALEGIPLSQLRATLPTTFLEYSDEVIALLDLCVDTESGRAGRVRITEYLVTMIASEQCAGVRRMVRDPVHISAAVNRYANALADAVPPDTDLARAAQDVDDAARRLQEASNVSPVLAEVRALKEQLGEAIFTPPMLRAVVGYNLAVWNRHEDLLDQTRTDDWIADSELILSIEIELEDEPELGIPARAVIEPSETERERAESQREGLERIEAAIAGRLRGEPLESELLSEILAGLELSEREQRAFADPSTPGVDALFRSMVATGIAIRSLSTTGPRLAELDLRPAVLQADWVRALNERVRHMTKQLIANGGYAEAREVSATKHRFLYASLAELIRNATRKAGARDAFIEGAGEAIQRAAKDGGSWRPSIIFLDTRAKRVSAAAILFLVLLASVGLRFQLVKPRPIDLFNEERLADLSGHIDSGYRKQGFGRLFVGTVSPSWKNLSAEEQRAEGGEIARRLHYQGIREVMLYDQNRRIRFHYAAGTVRYPTETSRAP
ncbi:MAG: hypothetical protein V3V67_01715 [Myxococcota bacterium]